MGRKIGFKHSQETREKMSKVAKEKGFGWSKGRKHTEETKKKIGEGNKGKKCTEETKKKMSKAKKGRFTGEKHPNWKGGIRYEKGGYISIYSPWHPCAVKFGEHTNGYVLRSRLTMEKKIGRYLLPTEIVHHINEIVNDDRMENLQLCSGTAEHRHLHKKS